MSAGNPDSVKVYRRDLRNAFTWLEQLAGYHRAEHPEWSEQLVRIGGALRDAEAGRVTLEPEVAQRLVDLLSRVEPWPLPYAYHPAGDSSQRVVIPIRSAPNMLYVDVRATPTAIVVMAMVDGGMPIGRHVFDLGDVPGPPR